MSEAVAIIQRAAERGASQVQLVRAALACVRAARKEVAPGNQAALQAVQAVERWTLNPTEENAGRALDSSPFLTTHNGLPPPNVDELVSLAVAWVVLGAASADMMPLVAIWAVERAVDAARDLDFDPIITAELL